MNDFIEVKNLSLEIPPRKIFSDIHFKVPKGSFNTIIGLNGAGKTQLLRSLAGLLDQYTPSPLSNLNVSFAFQKSLLIPWLTLEKNLEICSNEVAIDWLNKVGLKNFKDYYPHEISGGMQQKINLVRAFSKKSDVVMLDEPFSSLDYSNKRVLYDELINFWQEQRNTIFFVTHDIHEALYLSQNIFLFSKKKKTIVDSLKVEKTYPRSLLDFNKLPLIHKLYEEIQNFLRDDFDETLT